MKDEIFAIVRDDAIVRNAVILIYIKRNLKNFMIYHGVATKLESKELSGNLQN